MVGVQHNLRNCIKGSQHWALRTTGLCLWSIPLLVSQCRKAQSTKSHIIHGQAGLGWATVLRKRSWATQRKKASKQDSFVVFSSVSSYLFLTWLPCLQIVTRKPAKPAFSSPNLLLVHHKRNQARTFTKPHLSGSHHLPFGSPLLFHFSWHKCDSWGRREVRGPLCSGHACSAQSTACWTPAPVQNDFNTPASCAGGCSLCSIWRKPETPACLPLLWQFNLGLPLALCKLFANMKRHSALLKAQLTWAQGKDALYRLHNGYSIA